MTKKEYNTKRVQLEALAAMPHDLWADALTAIGIPAEVTKGAVKYENLKVAETYLWFCVPKCPEECLTLEVNIEAEEQALEIITELLDYASKQLD